MSWSAEAIRNRRAGQQRIRRKCLCGRIIVGNPGWASHKRAHTFTADVTLGGTRYHAGDWMPGHRYDGRA